MSWNFNDHSYLRVGEIRLPVFSGKIEDFPDFRFGFQELRKHYNFPPSHMLALLKDRVPPEIKIDMDGFRNLDEAWAALEERFGDIGLLVRVIKD